MRCRSFLRPLAGLFGLAAMLPISGTGPAHADILSSSATLPVLDVPFTTPGGTGCFPAAGVCFTSGAFEFTSPVTSTFNGAGQDIVSGGLFTGMLTTLGHAPIGPVTLTGMIGQEILGRTTSDATGTWSTELTDLALSGPVLGHTLSMTLDTADASTGSTMIAPVDIGGTQAFRIDSFFDVFVELTLDTDPVLATGRGPIRFVLTPEPGSFLLLASPLAGLVALRRRSRRSP